MNLGVLALIAVSLSGCDLDLDACFRDCTLKDDDDEGRLGESRYQYTPFAAEEEFPTPDPAKLRADLAYMKQKLLDAIAAEAEEKRQYETELAVFVDSPATTEEQVTPRDSPLGPSRKPSDPIPMVNSPLFENNAELKRLRLAKRFSPPSFDAEQHMKSSHVDYFVSTLRLPTGRPATIEENSGDTDDEKEEEEIDTKPVNTAEDELLFGEIE